MIFLIIGFYTIAFFNASIATILAFSDYIEEDFAGMKTRAWGRNFPVYVMTISGILGRDNWYIMTSLVLNPETNTDSVVFKFTMKSR